MWTLLKFLAGAFAVVLLCAVQLAASSKANTVKRVALVIGNTDYRHMTPLRNPGNDASDMAAALKRLGFTVLLRKNLGKHQMRDALEEFSDRASDADMGFVFFAGHGMAINKTNYLIPVDADLETDRKVKFQTIRLDDVLAALSDVRGIKLVVLDACRNNIFKRPMRITRPDRNVLARGFYRAEPQSGTLVSFAARDGSTAADGQGRNSPFTAALLKHIEKPGLELNFLFRQVRDAVLNNTGQKQEPHTYGSLPGQRIYLKAPATKKEADKPATTETAAEIWATIKDSESPDVLEAFQKRFKGSFYADILAAQKLQKLTPKQQLAAVDAKAATAKPREQGTTLLPQIGHHLRLGLADTLTYSPDGKVIVVQTDGYIHFHDASSGDLVRLYNAWLSKGFAFTPDGSKFLTIGKRRQYAPAIDRLEVRSSSTGKVLRSIPLPKQGAHGIASELALSPDGSTIATSRLDGAIELRNFSTGGIVQTLRAHNKYLVALTFSPDGRTIASMGSDKKLVLWDVSSGLPAWSKNRSDPTAGRLGRIRFSPDGNIVAVTDRNNLIQLWSVRTDKGISAGSLLETLKFQHGSVMDFAFSRDGKSIAAALGKYGIEVWDLGSKTIIPLKSAKKQRALLLGFSPNGSRLASFSAIGDHGSGNTIIQDWSPQSGEQGFSVALERPAVCSNLVNEPGQPVALSTHSEDAILRWDVSKGTLLRRIDLKSRMTSLLAVANNHTIGAIASGPFGTLIFDFNGERPSRSPKAQSMFLPAAAVSPNSKFVAIGGSTFDDGKWVVSLLDANSGQAGSFAKGGVEDSQITSLTFSPDSKRVAAVLDRGFGIRIWNTDNLALVRKFEFENVLAPVITFSADSQRLIAGRHEGSISEWDIKTGKQLKHFGGHDSLIDIVGISPDGSMLLTASTYDQQLKLWNNQTNRLIRSIQSDDGPFSAVALTANKSRLLTCQHRSGQVRIWHTKTGQLIATMAAVGDGHLLYTPSGHYGGSPGVEKHFRLVKGLKVSKVTDAYRKQFYLPNGLADLPRVAGGN